MVWVPRAKVEVEKVAMPLPFTDEEPSAVVPSLNVTVPVGCPVVFEVTIAVNVIDCFGLDGFAEEVNAVPVLAVVTV